MSQENLPNSVLYAISARIGGIGLDLVAHETIRGLRVAKSLGIPSLLEIPTWHRQKGKVLPPKTEHEIAMENVPIPQLWLNRLLISRQDSLGSTDWQI